MYVIPFATLNHLSHFPLGCMSESSDSPNWDAILYTLIESASMYLRSVLRY